MKYPRSAFPDRQPLSKALRYAVLRRAIFRCEDCRIARPLEMHHVRYYRDGKRIFGSETTADLRALCRSCHHARHIDPDGRFWLDPEEMQQYWSQL